MIEGDTDPGFNADACATCGHRLQEFRYLAADGRAVCSRRCLVDGVFLEPGSRAEVTRHIRGRPPGAVRWMPRAWLFGIAWQSGLVHLHVPGLQISFPTTRVRHPIVWLPALLASVLGIGVALGIHIATPPPATSLFPAASMSVAPPAPAPAPPPAPVRAIVPEPVFEKPADPPDAAPAPHPPRSAEPIPDKREAPPKREEPRETDTLDSRF